MPDRYTRLDALELVAQDHATIRELFDLYDDALGDEALRADATATLLAAIELHSSLETDLFYRALAGVLRDGDRLRMAYEEHVAILALARAIRATPVDAAAHPALVHELRVAAADRVDEAVSAGHRLE